MRITSLLNIVASLEATQEILEDLGTPEEHLDEHRRELITHVLANDTDGLGITPEDVIPSLSDTMVSVESFLGDVGAAISKGVSAAVKVIVSMFKSIIAGIGKAISFIKNKVANIGKSIGMLGRSNNQYVTLSYLSPFSEPVENIDKLLAFNNTLIGDLKEYIHICKKNANDSIVLSLCKTKSRTNLAYEPTTTDVRGTQARQSDYMDEGKNLIKLVESYEEIGKLLTSLDCNKILSTVPDELTVYLSSDDIVEFKKVANIIKFARESIDIFSMRSSSNPYSELTLWQQALDNESDDVIIVNGNVLKLSDGNNQEITRFETYTHELVATGTEAEINNTTVYYGTIKPRGYPEVKAIYISMLTSYDSGEWILDVAGRKTSAGFFFITDTKPEILLKAVDFNELYKPIANQLTERFETTGKPVISQRVLNEINQLIRWVK